MIPKGILLILLTLFQFGYSCLPVKQPCTTQEDCCFPALCLQYSTGKKCGMLIRSSHNNNNNTNIMLNQLEKTAP